MCVCCYLLSPRRATDDYWIPVDSQTVSLPLCAYRFPIHSAVQCEFMKYRALTLAYAQPPFVQPVYDFFIQGSDFIVISRRPEMTLLDFEVLDSSIPAELLHLAIYSTTMGLYALHKLKITVGYFGLRQLVILPEGNVSISLTGLFQYKCYTCYPKWYDFLCLVDIVLKRCLPAPTYAVQAKRLPPLMKKSGCNLVGSKRCSQAPFDRDLFSLHLENIREEFSSDVLFLFVLNVVQTCHWPSIITAPYINTFSFIPAEDTGFRLFRVSECSNTRDLRIYLASKTRTQEPENDEFALAGASTGMLANISGEEDVTPDAHTSSTSVDKTDDKPSETKDSGSTPIFSGANVSSTEGDRSVRKHLADDVYVDLPVPEAAEPCIFYGNDVVQRPLPGAPDLTDPAAQINETINRILNRVSTMEIFSADGIIDKLVTIAHMTNTTRMNRQATLREVCVEAQRDGLRLETPRLLNIERPATFLAVKINQGPEVSLGYGVVTQLIRGLMRKLARFTSLSEGEVIKSITFVNDNEIILQDGKERLISVPPQLLVVHTGYHLETINGQKVRKRDTLQGYLEENQYAAPDQESLIEKLVGVNSHAPKQHKDISRIGSFSTRSENSDLIELTLPRDFFVETAITKKKSQGAYEALEKVILTIHKNTRAMTADQEMEAIMLLRLFAINIQVPFYLFRGREFPFNAIPVTVPMSWEELSVPPAVGHLANVVGRIGFDRWATFLEALHVCIKDGTLLPRISLYWCLFFFTYIDLTFCMITSHNILSMRDSFTIEALFEEFEPELPRKKEDSTRRRRGQGEQPQASMIVQELDPNPGMFPSASNVFNAPSDQSIAGFTRSMANRTHVRADSQASQTRKGLNLTYSQSHDEDELVEPRYTHLDPSLYSDNIRITQVAQSLTTYNFAPLEVLIAKTLPMFFSYAVQSPDFSSTFNSLLANLSEAILLRTSDVDTYKFVRSLSRYFTTSIFEVLQATNQSVDSIPQKFTAPIVVAPNMTTIACPTEGLISAFSAIISYVDAAILDLNTTVVKRNTRVNVTKLPRILNFRSCLERNTVNTVEDSYLQASVYITAFTFNALLVNTAPQPDNFEYGMLKLSFTALRNLMSPEALQFILSKARTPIDYYASVPLYIDPVEQQTMFRTYEQSVVHDATENLGPGGDDGYDTLDTRGQYKQSMLVLYQQCEKPFCLCYPSMELCQNCRLENEYLAMEKNKSETFFTDFYGFSFILRVFYEGYLLLSRKLVPTLLGAVDSDISFVFGLILRESGANHSKILACLDSVTDLPRNDEGDLTSTYGIATIVPGAISRILSMPIRTPAEQVIRKCFEDYLAKAEPVKKTTTKPTQSKLPTAMRAPGLPPPSMTAPIQVGLNRNQRSEDRHSGTGLDSITINDTYLTLIARLIHAYYTDISLFDPEIVLILASLMSTDVYARLRHTTVTSPDLLLSMTFHIMVEASYYASIERSGGVIPEHGRFQNDKNDLYAMGGQTRHTKEEDDDENNILFGAMTELNRDGSSTFSDPGGKVRSITASRHPSFMGIVSTCIHLINAIFEVYLQQFSQNLTMLRGMQAYQLNQQRELFTESEPHIVIQTLFNLSYIYRDMLKFIPHHFVDTIELLATSPVLSSNNPRLWSLPPSRKGQGIADHLVIFLSHIFTCRCYEYEALKLVMTIQLEHFKIMKFTYKDIDEMNPFKRQAELAPPSSSAEFEMVQERDQPFTSTLPITESVEKQRKQVTDSVVHQKADLVEEPEPQEELVEASVRREPTPEDPEKTLPDLPEILEFPEPLDQTNIETPNPQAIQDELQDENDQHEILANSITTSAARSSYDTDTPVEMQSHSELSIHLQPTDGIAEQNILFDQREDNTIHISLNAHKVPTIDPHAILGGGQQRSFSTTPKAYPGRPHPLSNFIFEALQLVLISTNTSRALAFGIDGINSIVKMAAHTRFPQLLPIIYRALDYHYIKYVWQHRGIDVTTDLFVDTVVALRECCRARLVKENGKVTLLEPDDITMPTFLQLKDSLIYGCIELKAKARQAVLAYVSEASLLDSFWRDSIGINFMQVIDKLCCNNLFIYDYFEECRKPVQQNDSVISDDDFVRGLKMTELTDITILLRNAVEHDSITRDVSPFLRVYKQILAFKDNVSTMYEDTATRLITRALYPLKLLSKKNGYEIIVELGNLLASCLDIEDQKLQASVVDILNSGIAGTYIRLKPFLKLKVDSSEPSHSTPDEAHGRPLISGMGDSRMSIRLSQSHAHRTTGSLDSIIHFERFKDVQELFTGTESTLFDLDSIQRSQQENTPIGSGATSLGSSHILTGGISGLGSFMAVGNSLSASRMLPGIGASMMGSISMRGNPALSGSLAIPSRPTPMQTATRHQNKPSQSSSLALHRDSNVEDGDGDGDEDGPEPNQEVETERNDPDGEAPDKPPVLPPTTKKKNKKGKEEADDVEQLFSSDPYRDVVLTPDLKVALDAIETAMETFLSKFVYISQDQNVQLSLSLLSILNFIYLLHLNMGLFTRHNILPALIECIRTKPLEVKKVAVSLFGRLILNRDVRKKVIDINGVRYMRQVMNTHSDPEFRGLVNDIIMMLKGGKAEKG
ncbi:hypothetical protein GMRT_10599 [Giardia muris]|uniref:Uncharacterized protein n=1 Tax=Giardia muris TaxID=5742 RepID=A0A4Z1SMA8_GIAMU|nr:hypothetical protein GMRT_10599 [Giardia muris]|eukprot:TNJ26822.1 hypothetical protein GMRT_10599 [Giardia muris]